MMTMGTVSAHFPNKLRFVSTIKVMGACLALTAVTGCATMGSSSPEEAVKTRANARWAALIKGDQKAAYQYNTPAYRAAVTPEKFLETRGKDVRVLGGEAVKVTCSAADKCDAQIRLTATAAAMLRQNFPKQVVTYIDETWLLEDGQWWIFEKL